MIGDLWVRFTAPGGGLSLAAGTAGTPTTAQPGTTTTGTSGRPT